MSAESAVNELLKWASVTGPDDPNRMAKDHVLHVINKNLVKNDVNISK